MSETLLPLEWHTTQRRVRDLVPLSYNPRILTDEGRVRLLHSLKKFNLVEIPAINLDDVVLAGHQRLAMLIDLGRGDEHIDVRAPNRLLTKEELDEYNLTSNIGAGTFDYQAVLDNFSHLNLDAIFDAGSLEALATLSALVLPPAEESECDPEPPATPVSVLGDVYEFQSDSLGLVHRLVCGSSTDSDVVARALGEGVLADLVDTDPPYNVAYQGGTRDALTIQNDDMSEAEFYQFLRDYFTNCFAFMRPGAPIYVFYADNEMRNFCTAFLDAGLKLSQNLIWVKQHFVLGRKDFQSKHEPMLYGWKEGAPHTWCSDRKQTSVLEFNRPMRNADHPTMKPLDIVEYHLECSSRPRAVVFDGFGGSGSVLIACEKTARQARLVELDPRYVDVHVRRYLHFMRDNQRRFTIIRNGEELDDEQLAAFSN
jgi:site-specific DNA-methyltransferase (adenine-specific)